MNLATFGREPIVRPREYERAKLLTAAEGRSDPFRRAAELLDKLDDEEPLRQARIEEAFGDMAIARADLLASPLYAGDEDAAYRRLQALADARECRARAKAIREGAGL